VSVSQYRLVAVAVALCLQSCDRWGQPESTVAPATAAVHSTIGEITSVSAGVVTIEHQEVPSLGWPAMTMTFKAPDSLSVSGLAPGTHVEFSFHQQGSDNVLIEISTR